MLVSTTAGRSVWPSSKARTARCIPSSTAMGLPSSGPRITGTARSTVRIRRQCSATARQVGGFPHALSNQHTSSSSRMDDSGTRTTGRSGRAAAQSVVTCQRRRPSESTRGVPSGWWEAGMAGIRRRISGDKRRLAVVGTRRLWRRGSPLGGAKSDLGVWGGWRARPPVDNPRTIFRTETTARAFAPCTVAASSSCGPLAEFVIQIALRSGRGRGISVAPSGNVPA